MRLDLYVIHKGTVESRLLSHAGFDRDSLKVHQWKGKRIRYGGSGRTPIAWRIEGEKNVEQFCQQVIRIIEHAGKKGKKSELNPERKKVCDKAKTILRGLDNKRINAIKQEEVLARRTKIIATFLEKTYPYLPTSQIFSVSEQLGQKQFNTPEEFRETVHEILSPTLDPLREARKWFIKAMTLN